MHPLSARELANANGKSSKQAGTPLCQVQTQLSKTKPASSKLVWSAQDCSTDVILHWGWDWQKQPIDTKTWPDWSMVVWLILFCWPIEFYRSNSYLMVLGRLKAGNIQKTLYFINQTSNLRISSKIIWNMLNTVWRLQNILIRYEYVSFDPGPNRDKVLCHFGVRPNYMVFVLIIWFVS